LSKVRALRQTDRHTDRRDCKRYHAAYAGDRNQPVSKSSSKHSHAAAV